jgi:CheY-like chemotaxis protein
MARLLVVEDNPDNMKLFRALLTRQGHQLVELDSGEGLIAAVTEHRPDLILLDIQLPGRDGYALVTELRAEFGETIRVIALTAHAHGSDRDRALEAGFDAFITKPIDVRRFPAQIAAAIRGEASPD